MVLYQLKEGLFYQVENNVNECINVTRSALNFKQIEAAKDLYQKKKLEYYLVKWKKIVLQDLLKIVFSRWHLWRKRWNENAKSREFDQQIKRMVQRNCQNVLRLSFTYWRKLLNNITIQNRLFQTKNADLFHKLLSVWKTRYKLVKEQCNRRAKSKNFNTWAEAYRKRAMVKNLYFQKIILNRWRRFLNEQKSMAKADLFRQEAMTKNLDNVFHEWVLFSSKQKSISKSLHNLLEVSNKKLLINFLSRWYKYHSAENIVRAINHTSKMRLLTKSLSEWRISRLSLDINNQKATNRILLKSFTIWKKLVKINKTAYIFILKKNKKKQKTVYRIWTLALKYRQMRITVFKK